MKYENVAGIFAVSGMKILKYSFVDIAKEIFSMRIDPSVRLFYKGIYDGIAGKLGKSCGSVFALCEEKILRNKGDNRKVALVNIGFSGLLIATWAFVVFNAAFIYNKSVKQNKPIL